MHITQRARHSLCLPHLQSKSIPTLTLSTTVATTTVSITASATTFTNSTATVTSSTTATISASGKKKRWGPPTPASSPAFNAPGIPTSLLTSACPYFGVKPTTTTKTVTAATPSTTVTVTATQTNIIPVTVSINITVTRATTTLTSSVTTTLNLTATTSTTTTQNITSSVFTTTTLVQTSTTTVLPPLQTVVLSVHNSQDPSLASLGGIGYTNLESLISGNSAYLVDFTTNNASNLEFTLNPSTGELKALNGPGNVPGESLWYAYADVASRIGVGPTDYMTSIGGQLCVCQILSSSGKLQYQFGPEIAVFWTCASRLNLVSPGFDFTSECVAGSRAYKVDVFAAVQ